MQEIENQSTLWHKGELMTLPNIQAANKDTFPQNRQKCWYSSYFIGLQHFLFCLVHITFLPHKIRLHFRFVLFFCTLLITIFLLFSFNTF